MADLAAARAPVMMTMTRAASATIHVVILSDRGRDWTADQPDVRSVRVAYARAVPHLNSVNVGRAQSNPYKDTRSTGIGKRPQSGRVEVRAPGPKRVGGSARPS